MLLDVDESGKIHINRKKAEEAFQKMWERSRGASSPVWLPPLLTMLGSMAAGAKIETALDFLGRSPLPAWQSYGRGLLRGAGVGLPFAVATLPPFRETTNKGLDFYRKHLWELPLPLLGGVGAASLVGNALGVRNPFLSGLLTSLFTSGSLLGYAGLRGAYSGNR